MRSRILIVTTVPATLAYILKRQPNFLNKYYDVHLVTSPGSELELLTAEGISIHAIKMERGINLYRDFISVFCMVRLFLKLKPDLVHSYTPKAGLVAMMAAFLCRVRVRVHTFTGLIFPTSIGVKKKILIFIDKLICQLATNIVPESIGVFNDLINFSITKKSMKIIGYGNIAGVDTSFFSIQAEYDKNILSDLNDLAGPSMFKFCFIGRLNCDKGLRELVHAFLRIKGHRASLILVGDDDNLSRLEPQLMETITKSPSIHWIGFMHDIRPVLVASDILVLPSYREGFPNVVLQAGAMNRPVIATDVSGSNEVIENDFNGWIIPPKNEDALYEAMISAIELPQFDIDQMGQRARWRIKERFEQKEHWDRMYQFYRGLGI